MLGLAGLYKGNDARPKEESEFPAAKHSGNEEGGRRGEEGRGEW